MNELAYAQCENESLLSELSVKKASKLKMGRDQSQRVFPALTDWRHHSTPGDFSRVIWVPESAARAIYGSPISESFCMTLDSIVGGADLTMINTGEDLLAVLPLVVFEEMTTTQ